MAIISDPRLEAPELLTPDRKPVENVVIDWEHPLGDGLVGYWLLNGTQKIVNLVDGTFSSAHNTGNYTSTSGDYDADGSGGDYAIPLTGRLLAAFNNDYSLISYTSDLADSAFASFLEISDGTGALIYRFRNLTTGQCQIFDNTAWNYLDSSVEREVFTTRGYSIVGNALFHYTDGLFQEEQAITANAITGSLHICGRNASQYIRGKASVYAVWNRPITSAEHFSFKINPYQVLIPA